MTQNQIFEVFFTRVAPWLWVDANRGLLLANIQGEVTLEKLVAAAKVTRGLVFRKDFYEAMQEDLRSEAHQHAKLDANLAHFGPAAEKAERDQIRADITQGRSTFTFVNAGVRRTYDSRTGHALEFRRDGTPIKAPDIWWDSVDIDTLRAVHAQIMSERGMRSQTSDELRKQLPSGMPRTHQDGGGDPFKPQVSVNGVQQKATYYDETYQLINPQTQLPFASKKELVVYLNQGGSDAARKILVDPGSRTINKKAEASLLFLLKGIKI
jgi:hypothetical protein